MQKYFPFYNMIFMRIQIWVEQLLSMYTKWAEKQGYKGRVVEKYASRKGGIKTATIEFESEYAYGHLSGERGVHHMIRSSDDDSMLHKVHSISFLGLMYDIRITISAPTNKQGVCV